MTDGVVVRLNEEDLAWLRSSSPDQLVADNAAAVCRVTLVDAFVARARLDPDERA